MLDNDYIPQAKRLLESVTKLQQQKKNVVECLKGGGEGFFYESPTETAEILIISLEKEHHSKILEMNAFIANIDLILLKNQLKTSIETQESFENRTPGDSAWFESFFLQYLNLEEIEESLPPWNDKILKMMQLAKELVKLRKEQIAKNVHDETQRNSTENQAHQQIISEQVIQRRKNVAASESELKEDRLQAQESKIKDLSEQITALDNKQKSIASKIEMANTFDAKKNEQDTQALNQQLQELRKNTSYNPQKKSLLSDYEKRMKDLDEQRENFSMKKQLSEELKKIKGRREACIKLKIEAEQQLTRMENVQNNQFESSEMSIKKIRPGKLSYVQIKTLESLLQPTRGTSIVSVAVEKSSMPVQSESVAVEKLSMPVQSESVAVEKPSMPVQSEFEPATKLSSSVQEMHVQATKPLPSASLPNLCSNNNVFGSDEEQEEITYNEDEISPKKLVQPENKVAQLTTVSFFDDIHNKTTKVSVNIGNHIVPVYANYPNFKLSDENRENDDEYTCGTVIKEFNEQNNCKESGKSFKPKGYNKATIELFDKVIKELHERNNSKQPRNVFKP